MIAAGEHRYLHGRPVTILGAYGPNGTVRYCEGHIEIKEISLSDFFPAKGPQ